jgi:hypothetical protein
MNDSSFLPKPNLEPQAADNEPDRTAKQPPEANEKEKGVRIVALDEIVPGANTEGLTPVLEAIGKDNEGDPTWKDLNEFGSSPANYLGADLIVPKALRNQGKELSPFSGRPLVDLAAGNSANGYRLAQYLKSSGYVAAEPFNYSFLHQDLERFEEEGADSEIPAAIAPEDMLTLLRRLPDKSVSLFSSGVDDAILPDPEYRKQVEEEIKRVLADDGGYMVFYTNLHPSGLKEWKGSVTYDDMGRTETGTIRFYTRPDIQPQKKAAQD